MNKSKFAPRETKALLIFLALKQNKERFGMNDLAIEPTIPWLIKVVENLG